MQVGVIIHKELYSVTPAAFRHIVDPPATTLSLP